MRRTSCRRRARVESRPSAAMTQRARSVTVVFPAVRARHRRAVRTAGVAAPRSRSAVPPQSGRPAARAGDRAANGVEPTPLRPHHDGESAPNSPAHDSQRGASLATVVDSLRVFCLTRQDGPRAGCTPGLNTRHRPCRGETSPDPQAGLYILAVPIKYLLQRLLAQRRQLRHQRPHNLSLITTEDT